jgi:DNA-binding LacI/PurR family transcriptional regulator
VRLTFRHHDEDLAKERLYIDITLAEKVAGVIISPTAETDNHSSTLLIEIERS